MEIIRKLFGISPDAQPIGFRPKNCEWGKNCYCGHSLEAHSTGICIGGPRTSGGVSAGCTCKEFKVRGWIAFA